MYAAVSTRHTGSRLQLHFHQCPDLGLLCADPGCADLGCEHRVGLAHAGTCTTPASHGAVLSKGAAQVLPHHLHRHLLLLCHVGPGGAGDHAERHPDQRGRPVRVHRVHRHHQQHLCAAHHRPAAGRHVPRARGRHLLHLPLVLGHCELPPRLMRSAPSPTVAGLLRSEFSSAACPPRACCLCGMHSSWVPPGG